MTVGVESSAAPASPLMWFVLRSHWHHPEWCAIALATGGWLALLVSSAREPHHLVGAADRHPLVEAVNHSAVMGVSMMAPLVLPQVHRVATSSLWQRRYRAAAAFLVGFVGIWTVLGAVILFAAAPVVDGLGRRLTLALLFAAAALAPFIPGRRRRFRRCAATRPLRLYGLGADLDCARYGLLIGRSCIATCWVLMAAVMVEHGVVAMVLASAVLLRERRSMDPPPWMTAVPVAALGALSVTLAGAIG